VVRWNGPVAGQRYAELLHLSKRSGGDLPAETLASRIEFLAATGGLGGSLSKAGVPADDLPILAAEAASQWTATFNPRPFDVDGAMEVYRQAF
jgi:alcohol dehydrogenase